MNNRFSASRCCVQGVVNRSNCRAKASTNMKRKARTQYTKAKPLGLRTIRTAPVRRRVKSVRVLRPKVQVGQGSAARRVQQRAAGRRKAGAVRTQAQRRVVVQFFRHTVTRSAIVFVLLGLFTATLVGRAVSEVQTYRAVPTTCTGWNTAENVRVIDAAVGADAAAITTAQSATIQSRTPNQPASGDAQLKCKSFALPENFPTDVTMRSAQLVFSLAVQGHPESEDVLVLESSFDGQQWSKLDSFFLTEEMSNATHGGYWTYPFAKLDQGGVGTLQVRARFVSIPSDKQVSVRIDGVALDVGVRQLVSAEALKLPTNVVQMDQVNVSTSDEPVVKVEVSKQARLKFLGFKDTKRTVDEVTVTSPEGTVLAASYDVQNITQGTTTYAKLNIHTDKFTKPGQYTAQVTVLQDNKLAVVTTEFTWGVLVINMNRSVYWPGESVSFGMGVVDTEGHTVCDATLTLLVKAPSGEVSKRSTADGSVARSSTCGPDNVTDVADYSAEYDTADAGNYAVTLTAQTASGEYTITDTVVVSPVIPFAISRHGSMRIFPPAAYTMALDVRPQKAFKGIVEDYVPPSFAILKVSDGGKVIKGQQRTTIRWQVDWAARTTHTLTYRYDAPDISPELFRLGPVQVGDYQESRQWQIASDAIGSAAATRVYTTGFERNSVTAGHEITGTSGTAPSISTSTIRSGTYALRTNPASATSLGYWDYLNADTTTARLTLRAYIRATVLPSAETIVLGFYDGAAVGTAQASIHLNSSGDLKVCNDEDDASCASPIGSSSGAIVAGSWYRIELAYDFGTAATGNTTISGMVGNTIMGTSTTINHANGARRIVMGVGTSTSADLYWDDVGLNQDAFTGQNQWVGDGNVVLMLPTGNGSNTSWASGTGSFDYLEVDDPPSSGFDDNTTRVAATATGNIDDYTLPTAASVGIAADDRIRLVEGWSRASSTTATSSNHIVSLYDGSTVEAGTTNAIASTSWFTNDDTLPSNSSVVVYDDLGATTYTPITASDIDNYQIRLTTGDVSPNPKVTAVWALVEYVPAEGGRLWTSGFELQSTTAGMEYTANINTPAINTTTKRYGAASLRTNPSSSTQGMSYSFASADVADDFYFRAYVYMASLPSSVYAKIVVAQDNAGSDQASIRFCASSCTGGTSNVLQLWNEEDNAQVGSDSTLVLAANKWYMLELKVDATTIGSTALAARVDNVEFASGTVNHANGVKTLALGIITTVSTADLYWDDVAINQGTGVTQNTYPGSGAVVAMQPDAVGDNTAWNISVSCAAVDHTCVNEVPPNDATTAVASTTINQVEDDNLESATSAGIGANDRITLVHAGIRFNASSAAAIAAKLRLKAAASGPTVQSDNIIASTTTWTTNTPSGPTTYPITTYDQPFASTVWTPGALDTAQVGVVLTGDQTNNFQVTNLWLMVEYVPQITISLTLLDDAETATGFSCNIISVNLEVVTQAGPSRNANNVGTTYTCTAADGTYTTLYADAPNNVGDIIVISADTLFTSTTVLLANSTTAAISGVELRDKQLMLMKDNATTITNAILALGDNGDADIMYTVSSNNISLTAGDSVLVGKSGTAYTYDPGGTVTTTSGANGGDFHVNNGSTAYLDTATNAIGRDILVDDAATLHIDATTTVSGGDITTSGTNAVVDYSTGTPGVTMVGTGSIGGGTTPTITLYNLTVGTGSTASTTISSPATIANNASLTNGTLTFGADTTIGASLTAISTHAITYSGTPTVTMTGTGNLVGSGSNVTLYNLTKNTGGTVTLNASIAIAGSLAVDAGTLTYNNTPTITMSGSTKTISGAGTKNFYGLTISGSVTWNSGGTNTVNSAFSVSTGATFTDGADISLVAGLANVGTGAIAYSGTPTLTATGSGTIGGSSSGTISLYKLTVSSGTTIVGAASGAGGVTFANLVTVSNGATIDVQNTLSVGAGLTSGATGTITKTSGTATVYFTATGHLGGNNTGCSPHTVVVSAGTLTQDSDCALQGSASVASGATWSGGTKNLSVVAATFDGDGTVTFTGGTVTIYHSTVWTTGTFGGNTAWTFNNLAFSHYPGSYANSSTTAVGSGGITVNGTLSTASQAAFPECGGDFDNPGTCFVTLEAGSKTWTLNSATPFTNNGLLKGNTSTFLFTTTSAISIPITNNASTNYYYNLHLIPASDTTVTYTLSTLIITNNLNMGRTGTISDFAIQTVDAATIDPNITVGGTLSCNVPNGENGVALQLGAGTWTVGSYNTSGCFWGVSYDTGSTVKMNVAGGTMTNSYALYNVNIDPASAGTVTTATNHSIYGTLTVASGDSYSINASRTITLQAGAAEISGTGTVTGSGKIAFVPTSSGPGNTVTIDAITLYTVSAAVPSTTFDARVYGNDVEVTNATASSYVVTCASSTYTLSGATSDLILTASGAGSVTLDCTTNDPTWNIGGNLDYNGAGAGTESITVDASTWTVSGNVDLTNGTATVSGTHTLVMDGTSKTLTSNSQALQNATLSGTIAMANASHTFKGNLTMSGTVTCTSICTVLMTGTANDLVGGGNTISRLNINPASAGTITLKTSDLTVSGGDLLVATGDALTIESGRTLTASVLTDVMTLSGTMNGPGRFTYTDSINNGFPTGGTLAADLIVRFDKTPAAGSLTMPARTDYQFVEIDNSSASAGRTVTAALGTITVNDNLDIINTGADPSTTIFDLNTNDPTFTVTGSTTIAANTTLEAPSGTTLSLGASFSNSGTFNHNSSTVALTTTAAATISGSTTFNNLSVTGIGAAKVITFTAGTTQTIVGTWTVTGTAGNLITLQSSAASAWTVNPTAASVSYADISWSTNTGVAFCATFSTNSNNNTGWSISTGATCGIDVAGTSNSSGGTVKVAVNGSLQGQTTTLASTWTITGVTVNSGDKVTVFVDAAAESAETTGVTKYDGTGNIGGLVLDTNVLTVGSDDNASLVLTDLGLYDNDQSEDVMQTANASVLTVDGGSTYSTEQITIKASNTLTIGTTETLSTHHLSNAGTLTGTGSATFNVFGNWTNSSSFNHNTTTVNFKATGTGKTINNGASSFYNVIFDGSGGAWSPLTNTLTVTNDLTVTNGTFDTATGTANVVVNGNVQCGASCGTINMTSTNTFTQSVAASKAFGTNVAVGTHWTFNNLTFTASAGTPTITFNGTGTGQTIVGGTLSTTNSGTSLVVDNETNDRIIDANGAVTIGAGTTLQASSTAAFNVAGNWTNSGDFTDGTGTVTLDGGSQQTIDGQLTGANDRFNNLIITNASGSNPETSPSVIFAASADTAGTFTAATASTKLRFLAGGTYAFQNISFDGGAVGTRVALRSSSTGTSWALNVAGTRTVTKTDVRDSNACGQAPNIDATDGTNFDSTGNSCWDINTLTFAINDVAVGFGTLTSGAARWANAGATGSGTATLAHTLAVTTNARNGYALSYFGPTLVGPETIDAATFTGDANGTPGSKQFALAITTDGNGTIPSAYQQASNNYSFVPSTTTTLMSETGPTATETASVYYLCNIAATTLPGAYSTSVTYVLTGTF